MSDKQLLAMEILQFLDEHAKLSADYDSEWDDESFKFNGPDSTMLYDAAMKLKKDLTPARVQSDWGSGCYQPINDRTAQVIHNDLVSKINSLSIKQE